MYRKSELWEAYQKINIRDAISVIDQVNGPGHIYRLIAVSAVSTTSSGCIESPHRNVCVCVCRVGTC